MTGTVYIDIEHLCRRYSISRRTAWRWIDRGILPPPTYFNGPQSGGRWRLDELERRDAERDQSAA